MAITPGSRIGVYEVTSQIGEGGMGVVFKGRDTKLLRDVALKVLPDHFADDPDRLSRFQREAQLLASLNHPNIAQIYGLEQVGTTGCIVMELVEGETLSEKLKNGPLPADEAMAIAKQIADALATAHERGIVHRDLKPANIKLTPNGTVKVLDFGLAKALNRSAQTDLSTMPTMMSGSIAGAVVGTAAYMSPEQARGKEVDARTDIWAFGCVLYEMLAARQTFEGETVTDMLAKIVTTDPDLNQLPPETPSSIRLLLAATLNKNPQQRLQHIGDMRLFLDPKLFPANAGTTEVRTESKTNRLPLVLASIAAALAGALVPTLLYLRRPAPTPAPEMRFEIPLQDLQGLPIVSPNGERVAYIARLDDGSRAIWMRPIGSDSAQKLQGTDRPAGNLIWSPDSRYLAFVADQKWKKVDVVGGGVQVICDAPGQTIGFTWNRDGVILLSRSTDNLISQVSDAGGAVKPITALDKSLKETAHAAPMFLPDGKHFIYAIGSSVPDNSGFFVGSLDGKVKKRLLPLPERLNSWAFVPSGYLLLSTGTLTAYRFNLSSLSLEGQPITVVDGIPGGFSVSDNGLLMYRKAGGERIARQLTWFDRDGRPLGRLGPAGDYGDVEISPKGDRVAFDATINGNRDIWMIDVARDVTSRVTFENSSDWTPVWSPDGSRIVFASAKPNAAHIYEKPATGVGNDQLVFQDQTEIPVDWSHNGRYIVFSRLKGNNQGNDTWVLDLSSNPKKAMPFIESPFDKAHAKLSPDVRWIAYTTNDSGMYQIVVQSFPDPNGGKWQITSQGGVEPKWRHDGRELYYLAFDGRLMAVSIKGEKSIEAGTPAPLFETGLTVNRTNPERTRRYDVTAEGRFLISVPQGSAAVAPTIVVVNWTNGLDKK